VNGKIFTILDGVKRDAQKLASSGHRGVAAVADPIENRLAKRTTNWLSEAADGLRSHLENPEMFGKAADNQRKINEAWTRQIEASRRFHGALTTDIGRDPLNPYMRARGIDPTKAESYVKSLTNTNKDLTHQAVKDYISSTKDLAESIKTSYDLNPEKLAEVDRIHAAAKGFGAALDKSEESLILSNQYKALREHEHGGGIVSSLLSPVMRPGQTVAQLAALERTAGTVKDKIGKALDGFFSGKPKEISPPASSRLLKVGKGQSSDVPFAKLVERVTELTINPHIQAERVAKQIEGIDARASKVAGAAANASVRAIQFLGTKLPQGVVDVHSMTPNLDKKQYSDQEKADFLKYVSTVQNPASAFEELEHGRLTPQHVEALKAVFPAIFKDVQTKAMSAVHSLAVQGKKLSFQKRIQLGILLDIPTDDSLDSSTILQYQQMYQKPPDKPGKGAGGSHAHSLKLTEKLQSPTQRVEAM
jgi:hypothetical protein